MERHDNIDFIARRYRRGCFDTEKALRQIKSPSMFFNIRKWVAAACVALVILGAGAFVLVRNGVLFGDGATEVQSEGFTTETLNVIKVIDFDDAPLSDVVASIKEVYGVEVSNLPDNASSLKLSLHYTGNITDLIETINEILGTELKIKE